MNEAESKNQKKLFCTLYMQNAIQTISDESFLFNIAWRKNVKLSPLFSKKKTPLPRLSKDFSGHKFWAAASQYVGDDLVWVSFDKQYAELPN